MIEVWFHTRIEVRSRSGSFKAFAPTRGGVTQGYRKEFRPGRAVLVVGGSASPDRAVFPIVARRPRGARSLGHQWNHICHSQRLALAACAPEQARCVRPILCCPCGQAGESLIDRTWLQAHRRRQACWKRDCSPSNRAHQVWAQLEASRRL